MGHWLKAYHLPLLLLVRKKLSYLRVVLRVEQRQQIILQAV
jgi:hypothetical protein